MRAGIPEDLVERARQVQLVALDVDGVLTDGSLEYTGKGEAPKRFDARDGLGIKLLLDAGIEVACISGGASAALERRVADLGIGHLQSGCHDKLTALQRLCAERGLRLEQVCFAGDDLLDLPAMRASGLAVSVADAHPAARDVAHWVTDRSGGRGAVRELADLILDARIGLDAAYERYLSHARERQQERAAGPARFGVIVPARYGSSRLPGKPLRDLAGKPMIVRVLENAERCGADFVLVATDDERIAAAVEQAGGEAVMTSPNHPSGTDRLAEAALERGLSGDTIVVNVQGDEPLLDPELVCQVAQALADQPRAGVATLATPIREIAHVFDPQVVKVVVDHSGMAVTFSRAPIPWVRELFGAHTTPLELPEWPTFLRHVGLYAYRVSTLERIAAHPPVPLEQAESLEQLRVLWLGVPIHVTILDEVRAQGVDTEADLQRAEELLLARRHATATDPSRARRRGV